MTSALPPDPPTGTFGDPSPTAAHAPQPDAGTVIGGRYKLLEPIGEGGMGAVWMAQQTEPVRRLVAVKLIRDGMDSRAVLARFEAERQALALMDHPNIARVFDAGATADGRPYFVMELVKGVPITQFCDARKLTPRQRLELFVPVCQAVQHAHQKGVIHRDIKPSNVLVALYDDRPVPKVIDFGVAKAAGQPLTDKTLATGFEAVVGTPEYMSPEQAGFNQLDVDTRSDIYALGVLLYELLTGTTPVDRKSLGKAVVLEVLRIVREVDPPRPSQKLSTAEALPSIAANRGTEPRRLAALVRGELDWIVMRALEKDRTRRYETANGFAADVQRYLAGEPVQAVPPSAGYRLRKFVRRNRPQVIAAGLVFLALVGGVIGTSVGLVEARRQRDAADAARRELVEVLDATADEVVVPLLSRRPKLSDREVAYMKRLLALYQKQAAVGGDTEAARVAAARALVRTARIHTLVDGGLGAEGTLRRAADLYRGLATDFPAAPLYRREWAACLYRIGEVRAGMGAFREHEDFWRVARDIQEGLVADRPDIPLYRWDLANTLTKLGELEESRKNWAGAEAAHRAALALLDPLALRPTPEPDYRGLADEVPSPGDYRRSLANGHRNLARVLEQTGRPADAEAALRVAVGLHEGLVAEDPADPRFRADRSDTSWDLGRLLFAARPDEATALITRAAADNDALVRDFPAFARLRTDYYFRYVGLAVLADKRGDPGAALAWLDRAVAAAESEDARIQRNPTPTNPASPSAPVLLPSGMATRWAGNADAVRDAYTWRGRAYLRAGRFRDAVADFDRAIAGAVWPGWVPQLRAMKAIALARAGDLPAAEAEAAAAAADAGPNSADRPNTLYNAGCVWAVSAAKAPDPAARRAAADRAVELLRKAATAGYSNRAHIEADPGLDPLRGRPDFRALVESLPYTAPPPRPAAK
ncbi:MAG: serine/threonine protein kinase [Gemmataceae bacterium]|nr:serine/threonine protein kinase [Gemmataceae bacterium]